MSRATIKLNLPTSIIPFVGKCYYLQQ